jgi:predicted acetyltransferase
MSVYDVRLVEPCRELSEPLLAMGREFEVEHESRYPSSSSQLDDYFDTLERFERDTDLPPDRVRMSTWLLARGSDLLGGSRLRHHLIPILYDDGGNIGYDIRPAERGRGYGHVVLELTLEKARKLGLERTLLTCERDNLASRRIIEEAGGTPFGRSTSHITGREMRRYWIDL